MGSIGDAYDKAMAESFFSTLQRELLDEHRWMTRRQLGPRRLRVDRGLVQPPPPSLEHRRHEPDQLRDPLHCRRRCGLISTANLSGEPGEAH